MPAPPKDWAIPPPPKIQSEIDRLRAENERLLALKTPASAELLNITKAALEHAEAEVTSLRAAIGQLILARSS